MQSHGKAQHFNETWIRSYNLSVLWNKLFWFWNEVVYFSYFRWKTFSLSYCGQGAVIFLPLVVCCCNEKHKYESVMKIIGGTNQHFNFCSAGVRMVQLMENLSKYPRRALDRVLCFSFECVKFQAPLSLSKSLKIQNSRAYSMNIPISQS